MTGPVSTLAARPHAENICTRRSTCRLCSGKQLMAVWSFGETPLANAYVHPTQAHQPELSFPLDVFYCQTCHLVQLLDIVNPTLLFAHYHYVSSTSASFRAHFEAYAAQVIERFRLTHSSLVVDIGSNDGILLKPFQKHGIRILGIDPAENVARLAEAQGIQTKVAFFTPEVAREVAQSTGKADVITANNVFAHTDDVEGFIAAVQELMTPKGVFIFEVQYLGDLIAKNLFDIVYHEHLCYYHLQPLVSFFAHRGLEIFDVQRQAVHGGSIRVFVQRKGAGHPREQRLDALLALEAEQHLNTPVPYLHFMQDIQKNKEQLLAIIRTIKAEGKRIVGYGAPAKATTLLSAFGLDCSSIEYIVDDDRTIKQGLLMPGTHIPIVDPEKLYSDHPDYCLILAWNFADPIMKAHKRFTEQGGKFIVPVPHPAIL